MKENNNLVIKINSKCSFTYFNGIVSVLCFEDIFHIDTFSYALP